MRSCYPSPAPAHAAEAAAHATLIVRRRRRRRPRRRAARRHAARRGGDHGQRQPRRVRHARMLRTPGRAVRLTASSDLLILPHRSCRRPDDRLELDFTVVARMSGWRRCAMCQPKHAHAVRCCGACSRIADGIDHGIPGSPAEAASEGAAMARYEYVCGDCGSFEIVRPIGTAEAQERCPSCDRRAERVFSPPALTSPRSPLRVACEAADRSAHEPTVVGRAPSGPRRARPPNPLHARLPRP